MEAMRIGGSSAGTIVYPVCTLRNGTRIAFLSLHAFVEQGHTVSVLQF